MAGLSITLTLTFIFSNAEHQGKRRTISFGYLLLSFSLVPYILGGSVISHFINANYDPKESVWCNEMQHDVTVLFKNLHVSLNVKAAITRYII